MPEENEKITKKSPVKGNSPKKTAVKKSTAKKSTAKKPAAKKTASKKSATKKTSKKKADADAKAESPLVDVESEEDKKAKVDEERKNKLKTKKVKKGDMVFVDVLGKTIEEEEPSREIVFQASNPEDAKLLLNYDPEKSYQYVPDMAIVGKTGFIADKMDEHLEGLKFFEEKIIKLEPKDAFGDRVGNKIEKVSAKQFKKDMGEEAHPGSQYNDKKGRQGLVLRANQGRLIVDFNHPLAGKKIEYRIKVVDKIEGMENQTKAFIDRRMPGGMGSLMTIDHEKKTKTLNIEVPQALAFQLGQQGQQALYFKFGVAMDLQEHIDNVDTVKFIETYEKPPAPAEMAEHDHDHDHDDDHDHNHE